LRAFVAANLPFLIAAGGTAAGMPRWHLLIMVILDLYTTSSLRTCAVNKMPLISKLIVILWQDNID
jgi:hypothetical protein